MPGTVAHQVVRDPWHLFDANIFYPEKRTLTFSEHLVPQSLLVAPVFWTGGSTLLAYNLSLLAGFALTGWAVFLLLRRWTGSWAAGVVAGSLAAFNAHTLTRLAHLQAQHLEFLPLALLALDHLSTGGWLHFNTWGQRFFRNDALFPGFVALLLAGTAVLKGIAVRNAAARMLLGIGVVTCYLSFGTHVPLYELLFRTVPTLDSIRDVARFGQYTLFAVAGLAGFGAAWWLSRLARRRRRTLAAAMLIVLVNAEAWRGPLVYTEFRGTPRVFKTLAGERDAVVAYFPFYWWGAEFGRNGDYMLFSTTNWRPMLNGYSGFMPGSFRRHMDHLSDFPDDQSFRYLREQGVTHIVVDPAEVPAADLERVKERRDISLWVTDCRYDIYRWR